MTQFLKSINYDIWNFIQNGSHVPTKVENGVVIPKPSQEYDKLDKKKTQ